MNVEAAAHSATFTAAIAHYKHPQQVASKQRSRIFIIEVDSSIFFSDPPGGIN
jgi:hypothetical protein